MSIRVDLMKEGEFRHQGAVSGAFIVRITLASLLGFGVLFGFISFMRMRTAQNDLVAAENIWEMRKPYYEKIQAMKKDLATEKKLSKELDGWKRSRIAWHEQLFALQKLIPSSMQLQQLSIRGDLKFGKPPPRPAVKKKENKEDKEKKKKKKKKAPVISVGTPFREYSIRLMGRTSGEKAEYVVVQFVRVLDRSTAYRSLLKSIKLLSLNRDTTSDTGQNDQRFVIEAMTVKRDIR